MSLGVLTQIFSPSLVDSDIDDTRGRQQRTCLLPAWTRAYYVIALAVYSRDSDGEVMRRLVAGLSWITGRFESVILPSHADLLATCQYYRELVQAQFNPTDDLPARPTLIGQTPRGDF